MRRRENLRVLRDFPCEALHRRTCKQRRLYSLSAVFLSTSGLRQFGTDFSSGFAWALTLPVGALFRNGESWAVFAVKDGRTRPRRDHYESGIGLTILLSCVSALLL
jgi:hypothetical protein